MSATGLVRLHAPAQAGVLVVRHRRLVAVLRSGLQCEASGLQRAPSDAQCPLHKLGRPGEPDLALVRLSQCPVHEGLDVLRAMGSIQLLLRGTWAQGKPNGSGFRLLQSSEELVHRHVPLHGESVFRRQAHMVARVEKHSRRRSSRRARWWCSQHKSCDRPFRPRPRPWQERPPTQRDAPSPTTQPLHV